jgi:hypothetical protein
MELPDVIYVLIGSVIAIVAWILVAMHRRREHALRDRFAEEFDRILQDRYRSDGRR